MNKILTGKVISLSLFVLMINISTANAGPVITFDFSLDEYTSFNSFNGIESGDRFGFSFYDTVDLYNITNADFASFYTDTAQYGLHQYVIYDFWDTAITFADLFHYDGFTLEFTSSPDSPEYVSGQIEGTEFEFDNWDTGAWAYIDANQLSGGGLEIYVADMGDGWAEKVSIYSPTDTHEYVYHSLVDIPEPSILALMSLGLIGLLGMKRRK